MDETIFTPQLIFSLVASIVMAVCFIVWQRNVYKENVRAINRLSRFFSKNENYSSYESYDNDGRGDSTSKSVKIKDVANDDAELKNLINDINAYISKSKGTVAFSIIQNKTERRITMLYEIATSKLSFPTHIGLMGTFAGVFAGLLMFLIGTWLSGGITDSNIQSLISGVLVSMLTSCVGIWLLIKSHRRASEATNQIDRDKNDFYEWVQNELMPSVDVSMVEAIGKLHETIDNFEPTFSGVISQFKEAFKDVTGAFGTEFRQSVKVVADAVKSMGQNMDKVNRNIALQGDLLDTIKSNQLVKGMDAFVEASKRFSEITGSLDQFEKARRIMLLAAQETINIQKDFNDSLQIPKQVAAEINIILNRITKFEKNIEGLGVSIAQTQMVGNSLVEQIKENISAIKGKQKVAENYADKANSRLEVYFEEQKKEVSRIAQKYNEALEAYLSDYEAMLKERKEELKLRNDEFVRAIDDKLSLDDIRSDFGSLRKINDIYRKLELISMNSVDGNKLNKVLEGIRTELNAISAIQEDKKKIGFRSGGSSNANAVSRANNERDEALREMEEAKRKLREAEEEKKRLENERLRLLEEKQRQENERKKEAENAARIRAEQEIRDRIKAEQENDRVAMEVIAKSKEDTVQLNPETSAKDAVEIDTKQTASEQEHHSEEKKGFWLRLRNPFKKRN